LLSKRSKDHMDCQVTKIRSVPRSSLVELHIINCSTRSQTCSLHTAARTPRHHELIYKVCLDAEHTLFSSKLSLQPLGSICRSTSGDEEQCVCTEVPRYPKWRSAQARCLFGHDDYVEIYISQNLTPSSHICYPLATTIPPDSSAGRVGYPLLPRSFDEKLTNLSGARL
jgi:hypothetical protein